MHCESSDSLWLLCWNELSLKPSLIVGAACPRFLINPRHKYVFLVAGFRIEFLILSRAFIWPRHGDLRLRETPLVLYIWPSESPRMCREGHPLLCDVPEEHIEAAIFFLFSKQTKQSRLSHLVRLHVGGELWANGGAVAEPATPHAKCISKGQLIHLYTLPLCH